MEIKSPIRFEKSFAITEEMVICFTSLIGDSNPLHSDDNFAKKNGFKKKIAPGLLVGSFISAILGNDFPGNGTIYLSQSLRFRQPIYIDDKLLLTIEIIEITKVNWLRLKTICVNQFGDLVIDGEAFVVPPKSFSLIL